PVGGGSLEPGVASQIETHPDVARVIPTNGLLISPPSLIGNDSLRLIGISQENAQYLLAHSGVRLKEGRMFEPRTNEIVLSEEVVRALGLRLGDEIERSVDDIYYARVPAPLVLVGILEGDSAVNPGPSVRMGLASYEYLETHELFTLHQTNLLVAAREGRKDAVDEFLETTVASARTQTETYREVTQLVEWARREFYIMFGVMNCLVSVVVALVVGVINRIALTNRIGELGLLHAVGHHKNRIIRRITSETAVVTVIGWGVGMVLSWAALYGLKSSLYYARGMELDMANLMPFWFAVPVPVVVIAFAAFSVKRVFARLDAVAIIERGKLSAEGEGRKQTARRSTPRPLSPRTFYRRHRRRGIMLVVSMALMILGVAFPVFLMLATLDAMEPDYGYLRYVGEVAPRAGGEVDPGVAAQIRNHPAVARVIQTMTLAVQVLVPPGGGSGVTIYGVSETDLPVLMDLFDLQIVDGRLPNPRSNEIVISKVTAMNRGLHVGDAIGHPVEERNGEDNPMIVDDVPTEMVIVGLLSRDDIWLGFTSLEYLQSHELTTARSHQMLVVPAAERKGELDAWLEDSVASAQTRVYTYDAEREEFEGLMRMVMVLFAAIESIIVLVAAIALAALNYIFFAQRREEFGTLNAIGRSRPWLVFRTVKETISVVGLAWLVGAVACVLGLVIFQALVYTPRGLNLDFYSLAPWLFTVPIPLAVVLVSGGTIARTLHKLDPVAVIERR
ncbi:MAG: hypothetical protein GY832_46720, partial [Chloroflexi bacterium]|nr:hypothetical protein [Chloroflexota bacterium]